MTRRGRPLYFLGVVFGGWTGVRAILLWPSPIAPGLIHAVAPPAMAEATQRVVARRATAARREVAVAVIVSRTSLAFAPTLPKGRAPLAPATSVETFRLGATPTAFALTPPPDPAPPGVDPPPVFRASRWSGSAWAILRPDGRATPFASQLGGSQAGARLAYAIDGARRVALYARASTAIDAAEREAAVGVDWRPTRLPIHLIAEQRVGIEGVRSGVAVGAVGGVAPTRVAGPVRIEGYAQAGVIFRDGREGFADGSLRLTAPVVARIDLGLGAWGGAQRGAARVDIGPTIGVTLPIAGRSFRLAADWRERVAGRAKPGSGPAVSLGVDF